MCGPPPPTTTTATAAPKQPPMTLNLGDLAPDFSAETTDGEIRFHEWLGESWGVLFSHPADFTPVCTTELGAVARLRDQFAARDTKVAAVSVDPVESHRAWAADIAETQGAEVNFPLIADPDRRVATLYGMIHPTSRRHRHRALGVHHRPRQEGQAHADLPGQYRPALRRDPARARLATADRRPPGRHARRLGARRGRDHHSRGVPGGGGDAVSPTTA